MINKREHIDKSRGWDTYVCKTKYYFIIIIFKTKYFSSKYLLQDHRLSAINKEPINNQSDIRKCRSRRIGQKDAYPQTKKRKDARP